jgi:small subunit ribosomal protein S4
MEKQWRSNPPGMHAWRRGKRSNYGVRLREKQKVKRYYGLLERQFMLTFREAERARGNTGTELLVLLERRLDNVICKAGFALSRRSSRQMIGDGHVYLNGRRLDRPSYRVKQGDHLAIKDSEKSKKLAKASLDQAEYNEPQPWLQVDTEKLEATVVSMPSRDDVQIPVEEQLIVEMCSR